jgi:hypothetical protein
MRITFTGAFVARLVVASLMFGLIAGTMLIR